MDSRSSNPLVCTDAMRGAFSSLGMSAKEVADIMGSLNVAMDNVCDSPDMVVVRLAECLRGHVIEEGVLNQVKNHYGDVVAVASGASCRIRDFIVEEWDSRDNGCYIGIKFFAIFSGAAPIGLQRAARLIKRRVEECIAYKVTVESERLTVHDGISRLSGLIMLESDGSIKPVTLAKPKTVKETPIKKRRRLDL